MKFEHNIEFLTKKSKEIRAKLFEKFVITKQGHPGSVFSMIELATTLYYGNFVRRSATKPNQLIDKVIVSKGHATATLYPILTDLGIIDQNVWDNWGVSESVLRVFGNTKIPGIDVTSGSLGHGLGIAAGLAESYKSKKMDNKIYVFISEGELYEGSSWESLLYITSNNLKNIKIILDRNSLMILGNTEDCVKLEPISEKLNALGLISQECDGHNISDILAKLELMERAKAPSCLIANTIKGKGISFMENKANWHYWNPLTNDQINQARKELL